MYARWMPKTDYVSNEAEGKDGCPRLSSGFYSGMHSHTHHKHAFKMFLKIIFVFLAQKEIRKLLKVWRRMREKLNKGKHFFFLFLLKSKWVDGRDRFWRQTTLWEETTEVKKRHWRFRGQLMLAWSTSEMINLRRGKCILNKFLYCCFKVKFYSS